MLKNVQNYFNYIILYFLTILPLVADRPVSTVTLQTRHYYHLQSKEVISLCCLLTYIP